MKKIFIFLLIFFISGCADKNANAVFNGSKTANDNQFIMEYEILNTTYTEKLELKKNEVIKVEIVNDSGNLNISVIGESGEKVYKGNDISSSSFSLTIPKDDTYEFSVEGKKAKGSVSFKKEESN